MSQSAMLENGSFHGGQHCIGAPSRGLKSPNQHARPLNSPGFLLNYCELSVWLSMGLNNFLDDQKDGYENGGESLQISHPSQTRHGRVWLPLPMKTQGSSIHGNFHSLSLSHSHSLHAYVDHLGSQDMYLDRISYSGPVDLEFFSRVLQLHIPMEWCSSCQCLVACSLGGFFSACSNDLIKPDWMGQPVLLQFTACIFQQLPMLGEPKGKKLALESFVGEVDRSNPIYQPILILILRFLCIVVMDAHCTPGSIYLVPRLGYIQR